MPRYLNEIRSFAGMVRDLIKERIPKNKYYSAENINLTPNHTDETGGATGMLGSKFRVNLGQINIPSDASDYMAWRLPVDLTTAGINHSFTIIYGVTTLSFSINTVGVTPALRLSNFIVALEAATASINGDVYLQDSPVAGVVYIGFRAYGNTYSLEELINSVPQSEVIIKEFFGVAANGFFRPLKSIYINKNLYILSTNNVVFRIGVAQKDYSTGNWTYTVLLETNQFNYSVDDNIDLDGEIDFGERVSLYWTGAPPRVFYIKEQTTWVANSGVQYYDSITENPDAYFNYSTLNSETTLQVLENFARISGIVVNDTGGALKSGNWQYFIRQKTNEATSGTGIGSSLVSIFSLPLINPRLYGSEDGSITSKSVTVSVSGLNPLRYEKFELIAVNNTGGVFTGVIAGEFIITGEEMTITHTGLSDLADFSISELTTQQIAIKSAANLVIARNRLFISNIETEYDPDLATASKTILLSTTREYIAPIGNAYSTVNEYMSPSNIFSKTGYMWNETYRIGVVFFLKNGRVLPPYFVGDYKIGSSGVTTFELADVGSNQVAIYAINATIDLTLFPDIDGIPFEEAVYGFSIVRQECIKEVLATGYLMPRTGAGSDNTYFVGGYLPYPTAFATTIRQFGAFFSPDVLFENSSLVQVSSTFQVINYGQPSVYNNINDENTTFTATTRRILKEFDGDIDSTPQIINTTGNGRLTQFNSTNDNLSTRIDDPRGYGMNQKTIGVTFDNSNLPTKQTGANELAFYYSQIFLAIAGKYGPESRGMYQSTGHFVQVNELNSTYSTNVWGGDTFTQKSFVKAINERIFQIQYDLTIGGGGGGTTFRFFVYANLSDGNLLSSEFIEFFAPNGSSVTLNWDNLSQFVSNTSSTVLNYTIWIYVPSSNVWFNGGTLSNTTTTATFALPIVASPVPAPPSAVNLIQSVGITFYSQNRGNYQLRTFSDSNINPDNVNYPYTTTSLNEWFAEPLNEGELNYSQSYSPLIPATATTPSYDNTTPVDNRETNVVLYSELKLTNSLYDNYRIFKPLNRKEYPAKYGSINNTFLKDMNYLVIMMDEIVLFQTLDQQQLQQNIDGIAITIGDGTVLGAREQAISNIGSPFKTMAMGYKDYRGVNHISWFNPYLKKWMRWTGSLDDLGDETLNQSFLTENTKFSFSERSIILGHDFANDELFLTASSELDDSVEWDAGTTYNTGDIVYMFVNSILSQKRYFIALIDVPEDKNPTLPINQVNYWKPYRQSNFTLTYNEKGKVMSDFKWFVPSLYMSFNETFLTAAINDLTEESGLYEHNVGVELYETTDIDSSITIVFNDLNQYFKKFRILLSDISLQPYFMIVRCGGFVSFAEQSDIKYHRPHWAANVMNDSTISVNNPTGSNKILTAQPSGQQCEVTLFFRNSSEETRNTLREVIMKFEPLPPFFNK